jgi:hypothetical protein
LRIVNLSRQYRGPMSEIPRLRRLLWWITDLPLRAELWLADWIAGPFPETEADRIREQRMERLRCAFPDTDIDGTGPRRTRRFRDR